MSNSSPSQPRSNRRSNRGTALLVALAALSMGTSGQPPASAQPAANPAPQLVWIDTDIGDDIDDAFALALALRSPELKIIGISTTFGDTETRARIVDRFLARFLAANPISGIEVAAGKPSPTDNPLTQAAYGRQWPAKKHPDGATALLDAIRQHPGQLTLLAIGPLFNVGEAITRDPATFRKLSRVVLMGGSIDRGYDGKSGLKRPADAEWNINRDPRDAQKLFSAGVPLFVAPLDSTQVHLDARQRESIFAAGSPLTDQLALLYHQWAAGAPGHDPEHPPVPTLFDPVAAAYTFRPGLCPMQPMRVEIDDKGFTRRIPGQSNCQVCIHSDEDAFRTLLLDRILAVSQPRE